MMQASVKIVVMFCFLLANGCLGGVSNVYGQEIGGTLNVNNEKEFLAPGDAIRLSFWRERDLSGDYGIDEMGMAVLPLLGPRNVILQRPTLLKQNLLRDYALELRNQEVQVTLLRRVRVLGAVGQPGLYHVDETVTLADAIAMAGGATREGQLRSVRVYRNGYELESSIDPAAAVIGQLRSGDQITVPERSWISRNSSLLIGALISATAIIVSRAYR